MLETKGFSIESIQSFSNRIVGVLPEAAIANSNVRVRKSRYNRKWRLHKSKPWYNADCELKRKGFYETKNKYRVNNYAQSF